MALVPVVQYTLPFSTTTGQSITYELDILRTYDDEYTDANGVRQPRSNAQIVAAYDWITLGAGGRLDFPDSIDLVGTSNPIEIEWERDYDVYKPIIGSSAKVNLLVQNANQYADFNAAGQYEYLVRLRYLDSSDVPQDYWTGYMTPLDGTEAVTTFPFAVSYTATDGLGLLEQATAPLPTSAVDINIWDDVTEAIRQTGLDLDIYLDTKIQTSSTLPVTVANGSEAITQVTVSPEWVFSNEDKTERLTRKEQIEYALSAFNATLKQSLGRWYITNASTHGGTGDTETASFEVFNVVTNVYVKNATDATENLRYNIDSSETAQLIPSNQDLVLNTRRPYGSIECKPQNLYSQDVENGGFEVVDEVPYNGLTIEAPVGFTEGPTEGPVRTSDTIRQSGYRSAYTPHNTQKIDTENDVWFTNTNGIQTNGDAPIEISFDWLLHANVTLPELFVRAVGAYQVLYVADSAFTATVKDPYNALITTGTTTESITTLTYVPRDEEWTTVPAVLDNRVRKVSSFDILADQQDAWFRESITIPKPAVYDVSGQDNIPPGPGKLFVRFYYPTVKTSNGRQNNGNDIIDFYVDNLSVKNMFANDITDPTYERVQENYTSTYRYEPGIASETDSAFVQTVDQKQFIRTGNADDAAATDNRSLEEIGTQQKLNDFRTQFKYYEGNLVNLTGVPLSPHNKVMIDWASVGYTETESCIVNGGRFNVKSNQFEVAMYVPNQVDPITGLPDDIAPDRGTPNPDGSTTPGFFTENVDLVPMPFVGLSDKRTYTLNITVTTTGDGGLVTNGLVPVQASYEWTATPGSRIPIEIALEPIVNNRAVSTTTTTTDPAPEYLEDIIYTNNGVQLRVNAILVMPNDSELETLDITAFITDATPEDIPDLVNHTITFTHSIDEIATPSPFVINANGIPGDRKSIVYTIMANDNFFVENIDETHLDTSLSNGVVTGNGTQAATIVFDYNVPGTAEDVPVTITGSTRPATGIDVDPITKTLTITNSVPNLTVIDGLSIPFIGIAGQVIDRNITVDPPVDQFIDSITTSNVDGDITVGTPYVSGEDWEIPVSVTIVNDTNQPAFTIGGELKEEPYSVTFSIKAVGLDNATIDTNEHRITFDEGDFNQDITPFNITVSPTGNYIFDNRTDIITTINEGAVVVNGNEIVDLGENAFTANPTLNTSTGVITVTIQGKFPTKGGQYVLATAIIGNDNAQGGVGTILKPATTATVIRSLTPGISSAGGLAVFEVIADGAWNANLTVATQGGTDVNNDTGSFDIDVGPATDVTLLNVKGSYSPTHGGEGTHLITLETGPEPMYLAPGGPPLNGLATTYFNAIGPTYVIYIYARNTDGSDGALLIGNNVRQNQDNGGRTYEVPSGWTGTETSLIAASEVKDTWTFYI